ncbi:MAG: endonuclease/exonuclease/phosphatase family protein [Verrucomicrobia bacterium]|nr:endonuclease/exonuclease/phosphatase family protein [Verrucomicrobiota bacterium]
MAISPFLEVRKNFLPNSRTFSSDFAKYSYLAGRGLTEPFHKGACLIDRLAERSMEKDFHGRLSSVRMERLRRICWVISGVVLCAIGLIPLAIGGALMALSNLAKRDMTLIQPPPGTYTPPNFNGRFKMVTLNLSALPEWITVKNQLRTLDERIDQFIQYINENPIYDCICLQELFDQSAIRKIIEKCRKNYPYMLLDAGPRTAGMNSGLAILSKYPLSSPSFSQFREAEDDDAWANKGVLAAKLNLTEDNHVAILDTHFQSGYSRPCFSAIRDRAVEGIQTLYDTLPIVETAEEVFTAGDLNIHEFDDDLDRDGQRIPKEEWVQKGNFFHTVNHTYPLDKEKPEGVGASLEGTAWKKDSPHTLWNIDHPELWNLKHNRLDYILCLKRPGRTVPEGQVRRNIEIGRCSDHVGVEGEFNLSF